MADANETPSVAAISLDGPSVRLRPITRADYGFMWQCRTHPEILYLWMQGRTLPSFEQYTQELDGSLTGKALTTLLIETIDGSAPIGYVFAYEFSAFDHTAFFSIVIHPVYVQYGWAAEASILFFNYLFTYFDLRKISIEIFEFNQMALERLILLGARVEGRFRGQRYYQGGYHDIIRLAIMHEEWNQAVPGLVAAFAQRDGTPGNASSTTEQIAKANPFIPLPLDDAPLAQAPQDASQGASSSHRHHKNGSQTTR